MVGVKQRANASRNRWRAKLAELLLLASPNYLPLVVPVEMLERERKKRLARSS